MHELGVAQGILDIVREYVPESRLPEVRAVRVRVGGTSGVLAPSLEFCFGAIVADTACAGAFLEIEPVPVRLACHGCEREFILETPSFLCPSCGGGRVTVLSGGELQVVDVALEEDDGRRS